MTFWKRLFAKQRAPEEAPIGYADIFETMRYRVPDESPVGLLPMIYGFRMKDAIISLSPRPSFAFLETEDEVLAWQGVLAGPARLDANGHVTDAPLLRWNTIPSLLTSSEEIIATYLPVMRDDNWPPLSVQAHAFGTEMSPDAARDRYFFQEDKGVTFL